MRVDAHCVPARAFSLIELVIVLVILAIVVAIAIPRFSVASENSAIMGARTLRRMVQQRIDEEYGLTGTYPPAIDPTWFVNDQIPANPFAPTAAARLVFVTSDPVFTHPTFKHMLATAWWYNAENGFVRARVTPQATNAETIALYNAVNESTLTDLSQRVDP